jgi:hypothetical protein
MDRKFNIDTVNRLAGLVIEQNPELAEKGKDGYLEAVNKLGSMKLQLICGDEIRTSVSLQAALITAINTGKRAFLGGVKVCIGENTKLLLPWRSDTNNLNEIISELGGDIQNEIDDECFTLMFGAKAKNRNSLRIVCNGWRGGVECFNDNVQLIESSDFVLGGILAGSLGVALGFLRVTGEKVDACSKSVGVSLWRPDLNWLKEEAIGPTVSYLPQKYWLVGLGHLGQALTWTIGFLPFSDAKAIQVYLQDTDCISLSNIETGLLSDRETVNVKKTRVCSSWLEARGLKTSMIESKFTSTYKPAEGEPLVLIRGLDSVTSRLNIDLSNFSMVIDCGIGGTKSDFDSISIYNFPVTRKHPKDIWGEKDIKIVNKNNERAMQFIGCGFYGKAISTSFVGAFSSCFIVGEVIRSVYAGIKTGEINLSIRNLLNEYCVNSSGNYTTEASSNGIV